MASKHLPECRAPTVVELCAERGVAVPAELKGSEVRLQICAEGCPRSAEVVERAKEVARERGWLTDEGFVWEDTSGTE